MSTLFRVMAVISLAIGSFFIGIGTNSGTIGFGVFFTGVGMLMGINDKSP